MDFLPLDVEELRWQHRALGAMRDRMGTVGAMMGERESPYVAPGSVRLCLVQKDSVADGRGSMKDKAQLGRRRDRR